jgi:hypothetical protein
MPDVPWGPYSDYLAMDVAGGRVFATPQAAHAVAVFDVKASKLVTLVRGIGNPHGVFYSNRAKRLFVDDDSIYYDAKRQRIYSSSGTGHLETYQLLPDGKYQKLESMDTAVMAKTSIYSPELDRMYVSVPHLGSTLAKILVFKPTP